jgi:hypothetical protein
MDKSLPKDYEPLDFSEDSRSRKSLRLQRNNSENGPRVTNPGEPTPAGSAVASPTPDDVPTWAKDWEDILNSNPEDILKDSSRKSETEGESELARQMKALEEKRQVIISNFAKFIKLFFKSLLKFLYSKWA